MLSVSNSWDKRELTLVAFSTFLGISDQQSETPEDTEIKSTQVSLPDFYAEI